MRMDIPSRPVPEAIPAPGGAYSRHGNHDRSIDSPFWVCAAERRRKPDLILKCFGMSRDLPHGAADAKKPSPPCEAGSALRHALEAEHQAEGHDRIALEAVQVALHLGLFGGEIALEGGITARGAVGAELHLGRALLHHAQVEAHADSRGRGAEGGPAQTEVRRAAV